MAAAASSSSSLNPTQNKSKDALKGWTQAEMFHFLEALKAYGPHDVEKIKESIMTKSLEETKAALEYYTEVAQQDPIYLKAKAEKEGSGKPSSPLTEWTKLLIDNFGINELQTETATALRMIADLEKIPPPELTEGIDFRQVYHQLANAMEGKPITVEPGIAAVLHKCVIETALSSKAFIKTAALRNIIKNINLSSNDINSPYPTENHELAIIRHLASQPKYNPLNIPEEFLKPSAVSEDKKPK